jgi:molybdopterin/thiamine biosynthesis adenylyltransferase
METLRRQALPLPGPGGEDVLTLSPEPLARAAQSSGIPLRWIEIQALQDHLLPERYLRNLGTLGWEGQIRLLGSCVAVVGCGGLGGYVIEGLTRSGVGQLVVVDGDRFVPHNLNRQLLSSSASLGRLKVEVAQERAEQINPAVEVAARPVMATAENLPLLLEGVEVIVDALDNPADRLLLQEAARQVDCPLVHGAIAGFIGQVTTVLPGDDAMTLLYGRQEIPAHGAETFLGTPAMTPMLVAAYQVAEVIKLLLGRGRLLSRQLLYVDLEVGTAEVFPLLDLEE